MEEENTLILHYIIKVQNWVKELKRILGDKVILAIVGNKTDLDKERNVPADEASE